MRRLVQAPRRLVFAAWTRAEQVKQWFGPGRLVAVEAFVDPAAGGGFRFLVEGPGPAGQRTAIAFQGGFREVVPNRRLVMDWEVAGAQAAATLLTITFADAPGGTLVTLTQSGIGSAELLDRNRSAWAGMLEKLAGLFT